MVSFQVLYITWKNKQLFFLKKSTIVMDQTEKDKVDKEN